MTTLLFNPQKLDDKSHIIDADGTLYPYTGKLAPPTVHPLLGNILTLDGNTYITLPTTCFPVGKDLTVSFWAAPADLTQAPAIVEATSKGPDDKPLDDATHRMLGIYLPYTLSKNQTVIFDCGNEGQTSYDRILQYINRNGEQDVAANGWAHWTFTKDVAKGEMKIYRNGGLLQSGSDKGQPLNAVNFLMLGGFTTSANGFAGQLAHFTIDDKVLTEMEIQRRFTFSPAEINRDYVSDTAGRKYTVVGEPPEPVEGPGQGPDFAVGLKFGVSDEKPGFVQLPPEVIKDNCQLTIAFWARMHPPYHTNTVIQANIHPKEKAQGSKNRAFDVLLPWSEPDNNLELRFHCGNDGGGLDTSLDAFTQTVTEEDLANGQWTHWAFIRDSLQSEMSVFRNGRHWPDRTLPKAKCSKPTAQVGIIALGCDTDGKFPFKGTIAGLSIFGFALSQNQLIELVTEPITSQPAG